MELRKCECGGDAELCVDGLGFYVCCNDCLLWTEEFSKDCKAIQAWNAGEVE